MPAQFGMIGLGTMGSNLVLNLADSGIVVCGYDRDEAQIKKLLTQPGGNILPASSLQDLVTKLEKPRRIMMLVPAGKVVDLVIGEISPLLDKGDILIDGGNSHFTDTDLRIDRLKPTGILYIGMGVSGGEAGARSGPSLMPGGSPEAYNQLESILLKIAAQTPSGPCVAWVGHGSAGHYVKMVHNGIEYAIMQLISEIYSVLKFGSLSNAEIAEVFEEWNKGELRSFLIEISAIVFRKEDEHSDHSLVDLILDKAKQKGTGMWTSQSAMDLNVPIPLIDSAVTMRFLSARKEERVQASSLYNIEHDSPSYSREKLIQLGKQSMLFGMLLSYGQGLDLLNQASAKYKYEINISEVIRIWKGGCIIRSALLDKLQEVYTMNVALTNILLSENYVDVFTQTRKSVIELINYSMHHGIPVSCISSALNYFDTYRSAELPSNLIQAQRDYFGAHTYERTDMPGIFHSNWDEN